MKDFSLNAYASILNLCREIDFPIYTVKSWYESSPERGLMIRHDVDRKPNNSLAMAKLEHQLGVQTSYYFRIKPCSYRPCIIKSVHELGHEIGYHYEDLTLAKGNTKRAIQLFESHLARLRKHAPIQTIAMHGSPLSKFDNKDIWQHYDYKAYDILCDALYDMTYEDTYYFTDTGRTWGETSANLRDRVTTNLTTDQVLTTQDLLTFIRNNRDERIALVAHPERWDSSLFLWTTQYFKDKAVNKVKQILAFSRKNSRSTNNSSAV